MSDIAAHTMELTVVDEPSWAGGTKILRLKGRLDAAGVTSLEAALSPEYDKGPNRWAVDMSGVDYVSSAGVGIFLKVLSMLEKKQGQLCLFAAQEKTIKVFKLLGFTQSVKHFETEADARSRF